MLKLSEELLNDFSSPDSSKLPRSADSGTSRVQNVKWVLLKKYSDTMNNGRIFCNFRLKLML